MLLINSILFSGCNQLSESVKETFNPKDTAVNMKVQKPADKSPYDKQVEQQIKQVEEQVHTIIEQHVSSHEEHYVETKSSGFLYDTDKLKKAETALRNLPQYTGKEIFVYQSIHFDNNGNISTKLRHPVNPKYVDNYEYRAGKWSQPKPQQLSVHDDIAGNSVSLNRISFINVSKIARVYNGKVAAIEGAKPTTYVYLSVGDNKIRWFPGTINGVRERYSIAFNDDGTLKSFQQD